MRTLLLFDAAILLALYLAGGALLFFAQRSFIYPLHLIGGRVVDPPAPFRLARIATPDGETLRAWFAPAREGFPTILHLHGNGDTLEGLAPRLRALADRGHGVLALAFRGYPGSSGAPSETGLTADTLAALDWLVAQGVPENRIAIHGRSLGSGLAIKAAATRAVGAVTLEAAYTSIRDLARSQFPIYPAGLLLRDPYLSIDRIGAVRAPMLLIHGRADEVIPFRMSEDLLKRAGPGRARLMMIEDGHHNDLDAFGLVDMIDAFLRDVFPK
jgi:fermentation-respiration switch protein FrsA (DUF1100 family)